MGSPLQSVWRTLGRVCSERRNFEGQHTQRQLEVWEGVLNTNLEGVLIKVLENGNLGENGIPRLFLSLLSGGGNGLKNKKGERDEPTSWVSCPSPR